MAGGEASLMGKSTSPSCLLLPRASGGARRLVPALPTPPSSPDLVLGDGIEAKFDGWPAAEPLDLWADWVAKLRPLHEPLWRELGVLEGILASTYRVRRRGSEAAAPIQLVPFWSPQTDTFVFPWGEATVTLEDVATLPGCSVREPLYDYDRLGMQDLRPLDAVGRGLVANQSNTTTWWVEHFLLRRCSRHHDEEELLEHGAFLSMWLSRFVLPAPPLVGGGVDVPAERVLPIAVRMARGDTVALAPAVLASIYRDLTALKRHFVWERRTDAPSVSSPMHILQLWVWERFPELQPSPASIPGSSSSGGAAVVPRAARWHDVGKELESGYVQAVFKAPGRFEWRPYGIRAQPLPSFARCLHPCELVGMECIEQHSPHRVARQLGFDQDVPGMVTRLNTDSWEKAWETYDMGAGYHHASAVPSDDSGVTDEYAQWWKTYSMSCDAAVDEIDGICEALMEMLDDEDRDGRSEEDILASEKKFCSRLEEIVEASVTGSGNREGSSSMQAEGKTEQGSSGEINTNTLYYLSPLGLPKETLEKDANSTGSTQHGFCHPKREIGTVKMVQKASKMRQVEKAGLMKYIAKLAKEIREEEASQPPKK